MRPPLKVGGGDGEGTARKSYLQGYRKTASGKVNTLLGKRKLTTPPVKAPAGGGRPAMSDGGTDAAAGNYAKTPQPFRVSFGDTGDQADELE